MKIGDVRGKIMLKVAFYTLGCKVNQYETEGVLEIFKQKGFKVVRFDDNADIYVINTCTVTNLSDRKSRQIINKAKSTNKDAVIVVMGCYAQTASEEVSKIPGVNLVVGTKDREKIVELIDEYRKNKVQINAVQDIMTSKEFEELPISAYENRTRAFLKIQEGCSQYCSYCIIPYARGPIRSRKLDEIINEVQKLANNGFKEIVLTGIHIASYGKDIEKDIDLTSVIKLINKVDGIERIRLGSLEPTLINKSFIDVLLQNEKLCPHFHLSLQSGCNETLKRMNRKYTSDEYKTAVDLIRTNYNEASITTDIMVGFPGETENEFMQSYNFAQEICFSKIHVFKYSPRKGTPAAKFSNQVDSKTKEQRSRMLIDLSNKCEKNFFDRFLNTQTDVLFEQRYKNNEKFMEGLTSNYIRVIAESNKNLTGVIKKVSLIEARNEYMAGVIR